MEKMVKEKDPVYCQCSNCQGGWHSHHRFLFLRWILGIINLLMVFALGIKIGEFKGYFDNYVGYDHQNFVRPMPFYQVTTMPASGNSNTSNLK
jgi:hypothetical protein